MTDKRLMQPKPSILVNLCKWPLTLCIAIALILGLELVYVGVGVALVQCNNKATYDVVYYQWDCNAYYIPDFAYASLEAGMVLFTALVLSLGQRKALRFPILSSLAIVTVLMIMGIQKYGKEYPHRGLFLKPFTGESGDTYYEGKIFRMDPSLRGYEDDGEHPLSGFEIVELQGVHTHQVPRQAVTIGYSCIVAGNLALIFVVGIGSMPSDASPSLGKYKKAVDRFRSHLAAMIAPRIKPLSDDEEEEDNLVQREMESV